MNKKVFTLFAALLVICAHLSAQTIKDVSFVREGKQLTISYILLDKPADIRVRASVDGGVYFSEPVQNLSGAVGKDVQPSKKTKDGYDTLKIIAYDMREIRGVEDDSLLYFLVEVDDGSLEINCNGIRFKMLPIAGGTFDMGCTKPHGAKHHYEEATPVHKVKVNDFYMGQYEVTQKLWLSVMDTNPSRWRYSDSLPVEQVSWNDAQIFIARLSQITGYRFRLPTEAEWEYAARGGQYSKDCTYPGTDGDLASYCWYGSNSQNITHPVGQLKPNELGLYDMGGNVWEWCSDWMGEYASEMQDNPTGPKYGENRILRGGSLNSPSWGCAVSDRCWYLPDYGYGFHGFRLVLDDAEREEADYELYDY